MFPSMLCSELRTPPGTTPCMYIVKCDNIGCPFSTKFEGQPFIVRDEIPHGSQGRPKLNREGECYEGAHHCLTPSWNMSKLKVLFIHLSGCMCPGPFIDISNQTLEFWLLITTSCHVGARRRIGESDRTNGRKGRESRALVTEERNRLNLRINPVEAPKTSGGNYI